MAPARKEIEIDTLVSRYDSLPRAIPRRVACMFVIPLLTIIMDVSGIVGGHVAEATVSGMSWQLYFDRAFSYINYSDLLSATLKTVVFG